jgi:hypothetical protein
MTRVPYPVPDLAYTHGAIDRASLTLPELVTVEARRNRIGTSGLHYYGAEIDRRDTTPRRPTGINSTVPLLNFPRDPELTGTK